MQLRRFASKAISLLVLTGLATAITAFASIVPISSPTAGYTSGTTKILILGADGGTQLTLSDGTETVTFSSAMERRTVPGTWSTWGTPPDTEGNPPPPSGRILDILTTGTITMTLSLPASIFGFELEGNAFAVDTWSVDFFNGATLLGNITRAVDGNAGARLFAASNPSPSLINRVVITGVGGSTGQGFAITNVRYAAAVPEPGSFALLGLGVAALAAYSRRRK